MARRGRPPLLPEDLTPFDAPTVDLRARAAWLLRVSRLQSDDEDVRSLRAFAAQASQNGRRFDPARISQIETGTTAVNLPTIAYYEGALHLGPGTLRSVLELLGQSTPGVGSPVLTGPPSYADPTQAQRRLDVVFDGAYAGRATGGDWLTLTDLLTSTPAVLLPTAVLDDLTRQLVGEMARSVGSAFTARFQALRRMVLTPRLAPSVSRSVMSLVKEPGVGPVIDVLTLLGETADVGNARTLIRLLEERTGSVRTGAAYALLNMVVMSLFPDAETPRLERTVADLLGSGDEGASETGQLLQARLPDESARRVRDRPGLADAFSATAPPWSRQPLQRRRYEQAAVRPLLAAALDTSPLDEDNLLLRLLQEVVFSQRLERRHESSLLLMASPYRRPVAEALMARLPVETDPEIRSAFSVLLGYLADSSQVPALVGWLSSDDEELRETALRALAHGGALPADVDLPGLVDDGRVRTGSVLYVAGMTAHPALHVFAADRSRGHELCQQARWWLHAGGRLSDSDLGVG